MKSLVRREGCFCQLNFKLASITMMLYCKSTIWQSGFSARTQCEQFQIISCCLPNVILLSQVYWNNRSNSYTRDSTLFLKPTLTEDRFGAEFIKTGRLDLWGGQPGDLCTMPAVSFLNFYFVFECCLGILGLVV